jgi:TusA-related sulfurtransferase
MPEGLPDWDFEDEFDGGEESCGRVIINLYLYLRQALPGTRVLFISKDPGAPIEFPAWCRLTGNRLIKAEHPHYLFIYKPDQMED